MIRVARYRARIGVHSLMRVGLSRCVLCKFFPKDEKHNQLQRVWNELDSSSVCGGSRGYATMMSRSPRSRKALNEEVSTKKKEYSLRENVDYTGMSINELYSSLVTRIQEFDLHLNSIPDDLNLEEHIQTLFPSITSHTISREAFLKEWLPLLSAIKNQLHEPTTIEDIFQLHSQPNQQFSGKYYSAFIVSLLIRHSSIESAFNHYFDTIFTYLSSGNLKTATFLFLFLNQSRLCPHVQIRESSNSMNESIVRAMNQQEFTSLLCSIECNSGQALVAASHLLMLWEAGNQQLFYTENNSNFHYFLTNKSVSRVISSLAYPPIPLVPVYLKAISQLIKKLPPSFISIPPSQKHRIISSALSFARRPAAADGLVSSKKAKNGNNDLLSNNQMSLAVSYSFPSLANDAYDFLKRTAGGFIPAEAIWALISANLAHKNISRCAKLYKDLVHVSTSYSGQKGDRSGTAITTNTINTYNTHFSISWQPESIYISQKDNMHSTSSMNKRNRKVIHYKEAGDMFVYNIAGRYTIMALMAARLSAYKRYQLLADDVIARIPKEMLIDPSVLELVIEYCIQTQNNAVAREIIAQLAGNKGYESQKKKGSGASESGVSEKELSNKYSTFSRSLLCSLLRLYVSLGVNTGVNHVLAEIQHRKQGLTSLEFSSIVTATLKSRFNSNGVEHSNQKGSNSKELTFSPESLDKAIALVEKAPSHVCLFAYQAILNAAIHLNNNEVFYEFLEKTAKLIHQNQPMSSTEASLAELDAEDEKSVQDAEEDSANQILNKSSSNWVENISSLIVVSENYGLKQIATVQTTLCNLVIKKINREQGSMAARLQYLRWKARRKSANDDIVEIGGWISDEHTEMMNSNNTSNHEIDGDKNSLDHQKLIDELEFGLNVPSTVSLGNIIDTAISESFKTIDINQKSYHKLSPESLFVVKWALNEYAHLGFHTQDILHDLKRRARNVDTSELETFFILSRKL